MIYHSFKAKGVLVNKPKAVKNGHKTGCVMCNGMCNEVASEDARPRSNLSASQ